MNINIKDIDLNYIQYGSGKDIVLLHGWGQNIEMMKPIGDLLQEDFRITIIDFPGFGSSSEPTFAWTVGDYADLLKLFIKKLSIKDPVIIGHSFGGRVAIKYASTSNVKKIVLFGSPCIRKERKDSLKVKILKNAKKIPGLNSFGEYMKNHIGSEDYKKASKTMRDILVNTVNEDLSECAKIIKAPTLLIWGENDTAAPLDDARDLETIMQDAALIVLPGSHYAYLENIVQVKNILNHFLKEE